MNRPTFRQEAIDAQRTPVAGDIILIRPVSFSVITTVAALMMLAIMLLFTFGSYSRRTTVEGMVVPDKGIVKIYPQQTGIVMRKLVREGQHVQQGDVLYTISTELQSVNGDRTQAAILHQVTRLKQSLQEESEKLRLLHQDENKMLQDKLISLKQQRQRLDSQMQAQQQRVVLAKESVKRYQQLLNQNYVAHELLQKYQVDLLDQKLKLMSYQRELTGLKQSIKEAENQRDSQVLRHQNQLSQIERDIIDANRTLIEIESRREQAFTAPVSGIATALLAEPGQNIDTLHPIATIMPSHAVWLAHLFVPSSSIGFINQGDTVLIRYQAYPYQKFGQYRAKVASITRTSLSAEELSRSHLSTLVMTERGDEFYQVTAALDSQTITAYGQSQPLQAGMVLQADIMQDSRKLYEWIFDPLFSLTGKW
ncbi:Colicin V secretion protein CvaA [Vibrio ruber DSM 16370]|uniref:Colicin V secretion protein CvaA n=1 Tax=Vibrio ruber (strain DSM 16370 / JCM 11486 / BCRC 17186 / CECT 7878 / LMG 23124 / VR1) TaxID=1123498 RepID=A0A1R4LR87_VIBR1|nr:HlyD family efflux transporter periplasmic adaptor subunit [Vibrio ruber]SJN59102.1 Colicin V secretion protein CvaA [Vibrio ruber DSM 16370]